MNQIEKLLSEARMTTEESTQDESDLTEVRNKRKRFRKLVPTPTINVRPMTISIDPRPTQIQFAIAIKSNFPAVKIKQIRELKNSTDFFIQPEEYLIKRMPNAVTKPKLSLSKCQSECQEHTS